MSSVVSSSRARASGSPSPYNLHAGRVLGIAGLVYLVGSLVDLGILWIFQRQPGIQWEFVAVTNTADAWPRLILAVGLLYGGAVLAGSVRPGIYKALSSLLLVLGVAAALLGGLMVLNYLSVSSPAGSAGSEMIRAATAKTLVLCSLYFVLLVPVGLMGFKSPRAS